MDTGATYQCTGSTDRTWKRPPKYKHHQNVAVRRAANAATRMVGECGWASQGQ